jgi:hypothetical protein
MKSVLAGVEEEALTQAERIKANGATVLAVATDVWVSD